MPILVTGATGFAGGYLAEALLADGADTVIGLSRGGSWPAVWRHLRSAVALHACDLCDPAAIAALLRRTQPTQIYHLAGYASPGRSFTDPEGSWAGNMTATRNLYEAVRDWGGRPRILYVGSGLVYGDAVGTRPVQDEETPFRPTSPYAESKAAADELSAEYARQHGLDIVRARPFNHIGPRQTAEYAIPSFARQLAGIARGEQPPVLETGNLDACRDLSDVRDVVEAYRLLIQRGQCGEAYNVASGRSWAIREVLARMIALSGLRVEVRQRADLVRAADPVVPRVDTSKLRRATGWQPRFTLDRTLADTLAYWRDIHSP
jgi:GDP-4-dehydro-6-deoxy-D-mannose reductase